MTSMQSADRSCALVRDAYFVEQVRGGTNLDRCYQCLTCSLGCPVSSYMDYLPHQIVRMVQLGLKGQVLSSSTIWICAACETCITRCPNDVDIPKMMDSLKQIALREGVTSKEPSISNLHETFMDNIRSHGKQYELALIMRLKLKNKDYFSDIFPLGFKMMMKRKMSLRPPGGKAKDEVKAIFEKVNKP